MILKTFAIRKFPRHGQIQPRRGKNENTGPDDSFKVHDVGIASHDKAFKKSGGAISLNTFDQ